MLYLSIVYLLVLLDNCPSIFSVILHNLLDPVLDGGDPGVDPRVVALAAAGAPGHRAAGVTTAGISALLSGAHHVVHDAPGRRVAVGVLAGGVVPDVDGDLAQDVGLRPRLLDAAPPHHRGSLAGVRLAAAGAGQAHCAHVVHLGDLVSQRDDGHVLVQGLLGEVLVPHHAGGLALEDLCLAGLLDVVLAQADGQGGHVLPAHVSHAVRRGQDVLPGDERAAAELATVLQQRRDPRPLALVRRPAVDHLEGVLVVVVEPLLLFRHHAVLGVTDGRVLAHAAGGGVAGAGSGRALGRGGLLRGRPRGGAWPGGGYCPWGGAWPGGGYC